MRTMSQVIRRIQTAEGGFTLIELMVVVAVIAILAMIAYPSYISNVRKGKRGAAKADITGIAQTMERCFTQNNTYSGCYAGDTLVAPSSYSPSSGPASAAAYAVTLGGVARTAFTVTATPTGDQLKDPCGTLTLNQAGAKTAAVATTVGAACW